MTAEDFLKREEHEAILKSVKNYEEFLERYGTYESALESIDENLKGYCDIEKSNNEQLSLF